MSTLSSGRTELSRRDLETLRNGFGTLVCSRLDDLAVTDVLLNGDGSLFEDREGQGLRHIGTMQAHNALSVINAVAAIAGRIVDRDSPIIESELPIRNARFIGLIPPITAQPSFAIRLPAAKIYTFTDYVNAGIATTQHVAIIENAIKQEQNILVSGGTKSGKTTLLNAVFEALYRIYPNKRIGMIEEVIELQFLQRNVLALRTGDNADHQELLKCLMRTRPDIIVLGEVRDKAALQLIKASNTGHGSVMSTIHANTPQRALGRLEDLCAEATAPGAGLRSQIADAIGIIVGIERFDPATCLPGQPERRLTDIIKVEGMTNETYAYTVLT